MKQLSFSFLLAVFAISFSHAQVNEGVSEDIKTTIEFSESEFDFGTVTEGEKVSYVYTFKNTGNNPLLITNAKGSCGCTVPEWSKAPIAPGETGIIEVEFNTKGKSGRQSKRVTLTANTDPAQTFLTIKGQVEKKEGSTTIVKDEKAPSTFSQGITMPAPVKKPMAKDCFAIFPNPTTDVLKLDIHEYLGKTANITILNSSGKNIVNRVVNEISDEVIEFEVHDYAVGTYYVNIQIGSEAISTKCFVVAKK